MVEQRNMAETAESLHIGQQTAGREGGSKERRDIKIEWV